MPGIGYFSISRNLSNDTANTQYANYHLSGVVGSFARGLL